MAEPNNSISDAQTFNLEQLYKDSIATASDVDYFKIAPVSDPSQITIDFTGLSASETIDDNEFNISIRNGSDGIIASTIKGLSTTLKAPLAKDTPYYLVVGKGTGSSDKEYSVKGSIITTAEPAGEKNSNDNISSAINNATVLVPNVDFTGYLGSSSAADGADVDHYSFTTGTALNSTVKIDITSFSSAEDLYKAQVVTSNGTTISQGIKKVEATVGTTQKQTLEFKVTDGGQSPAGTYFLKINALNADNFNKSAEKTKPYTIKLYGTTDYNEPPSVSISGVKSGLANTTVENTSAKTITQNTKVKLSDFIVATDPDIDTANKTIAEYYLGLLDTNTGNTSGSITYKKDGTGSSQTITVKSSKDATGFLQKITAAEFATAEYNAPNATESDQSIYTFVVDNSGGATVPNPIKTSGIVFQKINTKNIKVEVSSSNGGANPNVALKEGTKDSGKTDGTAKQTLTFKLTGGVDGTAVSVVVNPVDGELELNSNQAPNNTVVLTPASGQTTASKTVEVWAKSDGKADAGKETLKFTTTSSNADYKNLTIPDMVFDVTEEKALFTVTEVQYDAFDDISKAATVSSGAKLNIDGDFKVGNKAVFSSPQKVIITSVADETARTFTVVGTDKDGNTGVQDEIKGVDTGVATGKVDYRSIDSITLDGGGNTTGKVAAGVASLLEGDTDTDTKSFTYKITATDVPSGKTLTVTPSSADLIVEMGGTSNTSHDFKSDGSVVVKVTAKQDNEDENNPEEAILKTIVLEDGKVSATYPAGVAIADIKISIEDKNKPIGTDSVVTGEKSTSLSPKTITFKEGDFGYSDPDENPLSSITITEITKPANAEFKLSGTPIANDDVISAANLSNITFKPENDKGGVNYASFKFLVNDGSESAASASTMKINIGKSVALNVQFWADNSKKIKSTTIDKFMDAKDTLTDTSDDTDVSGGPFKTDSDGKIDLTGVPNGNYIAGYKAATDSTSAQNVSDNVNIQDIMMILNSIGKVITFTNKEKVAADINSDKECDIKDIMKILNQIGKIESHSDLPSQFVLRDSKEADPFTNNTFKIESPSALILDSYLLGDVNGSYKDTIA